MAESSLLPSSTAATAATAAINASTPTSLEQIKPRAKSVLRCWFKAVKHFASSKTQRREPTPHGGGVQVESSVEGASTPSLSLTPITTISSSSSPPPPPPPSSSSPPPPSSSSSSSLLSSSSSSYSSSCAHKVGIAPAEAHAAKFKANRIVQHLTSTRKVSSSPATQALPTILVTPSPAFPNDALFPTRPVTAPTSPSAAAAAKPPRRQRQPTMLTPQLMREIQKANQKHHDIVMRNEEKGSLSSLSSYEPVVSPRANMARANPLRWSQD